MRPAREDIARGEPLKQEKESEKEGVKQERESESMPTTPTGTHKAYRPMSSRLRDMAAKVRPRSFSTNRMKSPSIVTDIETILVENQRMKKNHSTSHVSIVQLQSKEEDGKEAEPVVNDIFLNPIDIESVILTMPKVERVVEVKDAEFLLNGQSNITRLETMKVGLGVVSHLTIDGSQPILMSASTADSAFLTGTPETAFLNISRGEVIPEEEDQENEDGEGLSGNIENTDIDKIVTESSRVLPSNSVSFHNSKHQTSSSQRGSLASLGGSATKKKASTSGDSLFLDFGNCHHLHFEGLSTKVCCDRCNHLRALVTNNQDIQEMIDSDEIKQKELLYMDRLALFETTVNIPQSNDINDVLIGD